MQTDKLPELEEFIGGTNTANLQAIGDRLFEERAYKAAKVLYGSISNNAKLASCHVHIGDCSQTVVAARKANNPQEFRGAQIAAMHIIVQPDHLEELIAHYERSGNFEELITLLDSGLGSERAHIGMYTELGIL